MKNRAKFNLSHYHLMTGDMGRLYPIGCVEALPGDTFQHKTNLLMRVSPLAAPVMHPVTVRVHSFFVPNRLSWDEEFEDNNNTPGTWEDFITGGPDGTDAQQVPFLTTPDEDNVRNSLLDYMGVPPVEGLDVNKMPVRAFNLIFNEYYRDQDLVPKRDLDDISVPLVSWEKDYFTSARPWTQKGPDVTVPLGEIAPVRGIGGNPGVNPEEDVYGQEYGGNDVLNPLAYSTVSGNSNGIVLASDSEGYAQIYADLAEATGTNVNELRKAFAFQRYQEARARYGSRYTEYLRFLGVTPKDSRLQRPEFLGGGQTQVNFSEVLQTAPETGEQPTTEFGVGDLYGHGIAAMRSNRYRRFIEEHGYIITLMSVRPKAVYSNGVHRGWLRSHKEDFFQRELQYIGQQPVMNNEIYAVGPGQGGPSTFGYQDRYMEYRQHPSCVSAEFRNVLNYWHLARDFDGPPALNQSFVECDPSKRVFNEQEKHSLWCMVQHRIAARRLLSRSAAPKIF